ncbi:hypothetical protein ACTFIV_006926 [Dictyostelium citrinum]
MFEYYLSNRLNISPAPPLNWPKPKYHKHLKYPTSISSKTVIVTAAVYSDFNSNLAVLLFLLEHRAGRRPYTSCCHFAESCVFIKQSPPLLYCDLHFYQTKVLLLPQLRSYFAEFLQNHSFYTLIYSIN